MAQRLRRRSPIDDLAAADNLFSFSAARTKFDLFSSSKKDDQSISQATDDTYINVREVRKCPPAVTTPDCVEQCTMRAVAGFPRPFRTVFFCCFGGLSVNARERLWASDAEA